MDENLKACATAMSDVDVVADYMVKLIGLMELAKKTEKVADKAKGV